MVLTPETTPYQVVGKPEPKVDAIKLAQGKPAFTADIELRGMLHAKVLHSPHAHARITRIDASRARALPGVAAVLTWQDIPRVVYSTAGQSDPIPGPLDTFSLDNKVRFVGDRVAFVAAETPEIAEQALRLIDVEYEILPPVLDPADAMQPAAPRIHDEPEYVNFADSKPEKNLAAAIRIDIGDVEKGFAEADQIFEAEYAVPKVQQAHIEPHVAITYWDEDDRLVIRTSTQVPFHVRRQLAPVLGLPVKRIRVIKPRIGGGFGGKQEVLMEDVAAHLTIATGRPVMYEYSREEEFIASRSRHPMRIRMKTGVKRDGTMTANEMRVLSDTGAYGCHAVTVTGNTGSKSMALVRGRWAIPEVAQYPFLRRYCLHQHAARWSISRLWRAAGILGGRAPYGKNCPRPRSGPARIPPEERHPSRRIPPIQHCLERRPRAASGDCPHRRVGAMRPAGPGCHWLGCRNLAMKPGGRTPDRPTSAKALESPWSCRAPPSLTWIWAAHP